MIENYQFLERIGIGTFGIVYKAVDKKNVNSNNSSSNNNNNNLYAIKIINLEDESRLEDLHGEICAMRHCQHENILQYHQSFIHNQALYLVLDYCSIGSAREFIDRHCPNGLEEKYVWAIGKQMLRALSYLHSNGIIHRDIKAANILICENGIVKLGDFSVASLKLAQRWSFVGSPYWMAPEIIKHEYHDYKADIWSFGIVLYELLTGSPPLVELDPFKAILMLANDNDNDLDLRFPVNTSNSLRNLFKFCLQKNPEQRLSAQEILKRLKVRQSRETIKMMVKKCMKKEREKLKNQGLP